MFTYGLKEFKDSQPEAYEQMETAARLNNATDILVIADAPDTDGEYDVVFSSQYDEPVRVMRLRKERQISPEGRPTRFWRWTSRLLEEPETATMREGAQKAFDKFMSNLDPAAKVFYTAKADQDDFGTAAYDVVVIGQGEEGVLVNVVRVTGIFGSEFRSSRWLVELL